MVKQFRIAVVYHLCLGNSFASLFRSQTSQVIRKVSNSASSWLRSGTPTATVGLDMTGTLACKFPWLSDRPGHAVVNHGRQLRWDRCNAWMGRYPLAWHMLDRPHAWSSTCLNLDISWSGLCYLDCYGCSPTTLKECRGKELAKRKELAGVIAHCSQGLSGLY